MQNQTPPHRIKSWYDGSAASGRWENQFQKRTLSGETLHNSSQVEISKRVARDVDLNRFDHIKDLRDRENALRECANSLRVTIACSELMFHTSDLVIETLQSQLEFVKSKLLKLSLSRILGTQNCVKRMFEIRSSTVRIRVNVGGDDNTEPHWLRIRVNVGDDNTEPHWRHGFVVSTKKDSETLDVRGVRVYKG